MFGLFKSTRSKATKGATDALQFMIAMLPLPDSPCVMWYDPYVRALSRMWYDPYILGYTNTCAGFEAWRMTDGKATAEDHGFALIEAYTAGAKITAIAMTNPLRLDPIEPVRGADIAMLAYDFFLAKDPEFVRGVENAKTLFQYSQNGLKDEDSNAVVQKAKRSAEAFVEQPSQAQIGGCMMVHVWVDEVKRVGDEYGAS